MTPFQTFVRGLMADARLGRYIPPDVAAKGPEHLVLHLALRLADATEGRQPHPAHLLLDELDAPQVRR